MPHCQSIDSSHRSCVFTIRIACFAWALACGPLGLLGIALATPPKLPLTSPESVGLRSERLATIDAIVEEGIAAGRMPGCVIAVGRYGQIALLKAYGNRQVEPAAVPMTIDTVFDLASITKPVATGTSVMMLLEQGKLRLRAHVAEYFPNFGQHGKEAVTVTQLLIHHSGLIADNALSDYDGDPTSAWQKIEGLELSLPIESKFVYSDVGFIVLGELVKQVSGLSVHEFTQQNLFQPLGMSDTGYLPAEQIRSRAAPTEQRDGQWLQGVVHDPRAARLGGVAGHAGLFSTATDLAVYAQMMLQGGAYRGVRVLSPRTVELMTAPLEVSGNLRSLSWDKNSVYSSNRGENFSSRAFGHGGFTGTVLWIDPELDLFFIFLSNRVHPNGTGNVNSLAGRIATVIGASIDPLLESPQAGATGPLASELEAALDAALHGGTASANVAAEVLTGIDVVQRDGYRLLDGQRVGLITNHTGVNQAGVRTIDLFREAPNVNLVALFSPEHGLAGELDAAKIGDSQDNASGLRVYSLYGESRRPAAEQLDQVDTLVFDIQDVGARFYTYVSTMLLALQAAAESGKRFVVLDRPNPINGMDVDGPMLDAGRESFVGAHRLPVRHGMTVGELARMFATELNLPVDLQVVAAEGWSRTQLGDETGLPWINPSPNIRCLNQALLYPGIGLLETTNVSVGRGTDTPFERVGAPWIDGLKLARRLNAAQLSGIRFMPVRFQPASSVFAGSECQGVHLAITERHLLNPLDVGLEIAVALHELYPNAWQVDNYDRLLGNDETLHLLRQNASVAAIRAAFIPDLHAFRLRRTAFLLY